MGAKNVGESGEAQPAEPHETESASSRPRQRAKLIASWLALAVFPAGTAFNWPPEHGSQGGRTPWLIYGHSLACCFSIIILVVLARPGRCKPNHPRRGRTHQAGSTPASERYDPQRPR